MPSDAAVVDVLKSIPEYTRAFQRAFPRETDPVTFDHAAEAIAAFERGLITPARWDQYLVGEYALLSQDEKSGFDLFVGTGCAACHSGALVGGGSFQRLGVAAPYPDSSDAGRYRITRIESDRMVFKVPSLRNIVMTRPYFHNGKIDSLEQAIEQMAQYQLGKRLRTAETRLIAAWLGTLTGELPDHYITAPELPKSTLRTPRPLL